MQKIDTKLSLIQQKVEQKLPINIMIVGLGSVGLYLFEYLIGLQDSSLHLIVVGRDADKMNKDVNIIRTAATIRGALQSKISIESGCDLENIESISNVISKYKPDFIINCSRVFSGYKYGAISWHNLRAYGIWAPLSVRYIRNIMMAYSQAQSNAIVINTSYSDAVNAWLKSAGIAYPDFGSGNLNHLIPRIKFYVAQQFNIDNLNEIDITLAVSHFHDVVISKEGHSENQKVLLHIAYKGKELTVNQKELFKACAIAMPTDQKRNMMNASSNFEIIHSILDSITNKKQIKIHTPGVLGEIGGYPYVIDSTNKTVCSYLHTDIFSIENMRLSNKESIYLDGIEDIQNGNLIYTDELIQKIKTAFQVDLPKVVNFNEIDDFGNFIIDKIIVPNIAK